MKWISTINHIGDKAIDTRDKMIILFDEKVNDELEKVSIIQKFDKNTPINNFVFKKGDTITIDGQTYVAKYVGPMAESNMKALGHATIYFDKPVPKTSLANAIYLTIADDQKFPEFKINDEIVYEHI